MDNVKTGQLIKQLRLEKQLTQKQLAEKLHITDRAVSKWERGMSAPDIALLEPLSEALGVSVLELIRGERSAGAEWPEAESAARETLSYSRSELKARERRLSRRHLAFAAAVLLVAAAAAYYVLVCRGAAFIADRFDSPDGAMTATIYDRHIYSRGLSIPRDNSVTIEVTGGERAWTGYMDGCEYVDAAWSPNGERLVLVVEGWAQPGVTFLRLYDGLSNQPDFYFNLAHGLYISELARYGFRLIEYDVDVDIYFMQWAADSESMLLYYAFTDVSGVERCGYFWYNCSSGAIEDIYEIS